MTNSKITLLKDGIYNSLLMIHKEYVALGHDADTAKFYTSKILREYLHQFSTSDTMEEEVKNIIDSLTEKRIATSDESECARLYKQIETLTETLAIIKEVSSNG